MAVPVVVLQPFTGERGPARRATEQESARLLSPAAQARVADALEAKHRVERCKRGSC